jgi:hypothetical protein
LTNIPELHRVFLKADVVYGLDKHFAPCPDLISKKNVQRAELLKIAAPKLEDGRNFSAYFSLK